MNGDMYRYICIGIPDAQTTDSLPVELRFYSGDILKNLSNSDFIGFEGERYPLVSTFIQFTDNAGRPQLFHRWKLSRDSYGDMALNCTFWRSGETDRVSITTDEDGLYFMAEKKKRATNVWDPFVVSQRSLTFWAFGIGVLALVFAMLLLWFGLKGFARFATTISLFALGCGAYTLAVDVFYHNAVSMSARSLPPWALLLIGIALATLSIVPRVNVLAMVFYGMTIGAAAGLPLAVVFAPAFAYVPRGYGGYPAMALGVLLGCIAGAIVLPLVTRGLLRNYQGKAE